MLSSLSLSSDLLQRLARRAETEGVPLERLLERWLETDPQSAVQPAPEVPPHPDPSNADELLRYKLLSEMMSDYFMSVRVDPDGGMIPEWAGGRFQEITGFSPDEVSTLQNTVTTHPDDLARHQRDLAETLKNKRTTTEYRVLNPRGDITWVRVSRLPIWDEAQGRVVRFYAAGQDITDRIKAEEELRKSEARLRSLVESQTALIARAGPTGLFTYCNQPFADLYGVLPQELIGRPAVADVLAEDRERVFAAIAESGQQPGKPVRVTLRFDRGGGLAGWLLCEIVAIQDEADAIAEFQCIGFDITEQMERESRYKLLTEMMSDYIISVRVEPDGRFIGEWAVGRFEEITGYSRENPGELQYKNTTHPDDEPKHRRDLAETLRNKRTVTEYRVLNQKGGHTWVRVSRVPVWDEAEGRVVRFYSAVHDINDRVKIEEDLRKSEERYRIVSELMSDYAICIGIDPDGKLYTEWISGRYQEITGHKDISPGQLPPISQIHPEDVAIHRRDIERTLQNQATTSEYRIINASTGQIVWLSVSRKPEWDEQQGRVMRFYSAVQDITERKRAEQDRLEQEHLRSTLKKEQQYNTLIQRAVSALNHDIRTPLTVIATAKDMLGNYFDRLDENKRREKLDSIERQLRYVIELLDEVASVVQGQLGARTFSPTPTNMAALCEASVNEMVSVSDGTRRLRFIAHQRLEAVMIDETLVSRILLNLLSNAVKFSPPQSTVLLELDREDDRIVLRVSDQGVGISAEDQQHIFEPFYRTNSAADVQGTGLGLSIVRESVERHQGKISVRSQLRHGTTFVVELPLVKAQHSGEESQARA